MQHKFRLSLAAMLLQALLLIMPISAFAATESNQEIGVPWPLAVLAKGCFGVVLSPDGDGFYSLRDGLLSHYQIEPFKKIGSIAIDEAQLKDIPDEMACRVLITDDGSKLILVFPDWLVSLDRATGKVTKKVERKLGYRALGSESATLNASDLVILSRVETKGMEVFYLAVFEVDTFQLKRPVMDIQRKFEFSYTGRALTGGQVARIHDKLYLSSGSTLAVLNNKTYEPEVTLSCPESRYYGFGMSFPAISRDHRKLYAMNATFVNDYRTQTKTDHGESAGDRSTLIFDQETRQSSIEPTDKKKESERFWRRDLYEPFLFGGTVTRNKDYVALGGGRIAPRNTNNKYYTFYQCESGEAILEEVQPTSTPGAKPYLNRSYHLTPNARQCLMMRNREGKVVPINDITFKQEISTESPR